MVQQMAMMFSEIRKMVAKAQQWENLPDAATSSPKTPQGPEKGEEERNKALNPPAREKEWSGRRKLELPVFSGDDPINWVEKANGISKGEILEAVVLFL